MSAESSTLVSRVIGMSGDMGLLTGMKKKFASPHTKLLRICTETGNVSKLEKLVAAHRDFDIKTARFVSSSLAA